jgi:hypothetical protein
LNKEHQIDPNRVEEIGSKTLPRPPPHRAGSERKREREREKRGRRGEREEREEREESTQRNYPLWCRGY